ncbi:hypothetical protein DAEQUDRAFT_13075 [Daedalea quercina L-15889]|uniref:Uncharacterized protein n=1 Tax=Daedalea quercina L-15889 TaxID=1314783 RepID=A0A165UHL4_9APHY|nr:hypothetical protein DAEQUDRAFT_13075 [Daedalea quercina L-15889]
MSSSIWFVVYTMIQEIGRRCKDGGDETRIYDHIDKITGQRNRSVVVKRTWTSGTKRFGRLDRVHYSTVIGLIHETSTLSLSRAMRPPVNDEAHGQNGTAMAEGPRHVYAADCTMLYGIGLQRDITLSSLFYFIYVCRPFRCGRDDPFRKEGYPHTAH